MVEWSVLIWVLAAILPVTELRLKLSSYPLFVGSYCPGNVTFMCTGVEVPISLSWLLNGSSLDTYYFFSTGNEKFPILHYDRNGIKIIIVNVSLTSSTTINITSTLTADITQLQDSTISCRAFTSNSPSYFVRLKDPPSPPVLSLCTLSDQYSLVLQWSTQSQDEELQVDYVEQSALSSGRLQCSNINEVHSSGTLRCNGLKENSSYGFNVTSQNCRTQTNGPKHFVLSIAKKLSTIFNISATYLAENYVFINIDWDYRSLKDSILVNSVYSENENPPSTAMINIIIEELPIRRIIFNQTFFQDSDRFCSDNLKCSVSQGLVNPQSIDSSYRVNVVTFYRNSPTHCDIPTNQYFTKIPAYYSTLFNFTLLSINNSIYALCSSSISILTCDLQYTTSSQYRNLTSIVTTPSNIPFRLQMQPTTKVPYYFYVTINMDPTLQIRTYYGPLFIHIVNKENELLSSIKMAPATLTNVPQLFQGYQTEGVVIVLLAISFVGVLIALTVIAVLCYRVKTVRKSLNHNQISITSNRVELTQVPNQEKEECEIIYDEPDIRRSLYSEVKNDAYNRYEHHCADKIHHVDSVLNLTYDRPTL